MVSPLRVDLRLKPEKPDSANGSWSEVSAVLQPSYLHRNYFFTRNYSAIVVEF